MKALRVAFLPGRRDGVQNSLFHRPAKMGHYLRETKSMQAIKPVKHKNHLISLCLSSSNLKPSDMPIMTPFHDAKRLRQAPTTRPVAWESAISLPISAGDGSVLARVPGSAACGLRVQREAGYSTQDSVRLQECHPRVAFCFFFLRRVSEQAFLEIFPQFQFILLSAKQNPWNNLWVLFNGQL